MRAGMVGAFVAWALCFCPPALARDEAPPAIAVGIVWWPADPADPMSALGSELEDCLANQIREAAPEIAVTRQRAIRDALYPLLEPATQPASETEFAALLARPDVRERLLRRGLRYLVAFSGGTLKEKPGGFILCGAGMGGGGCLGFSWRSETTALDAALWSLDDATKMGQAEAKAEGALVMPAFVLPVPIPARTRAQACQALGNRIALAVRQSAAASRSRPDQR